MLESKPIILKQLFLEMFVYQLKCAKCVIRLIVSFFHKVIGLLSKYVIKLRGRRVSKKMMEDYVIKYKMISFVKIEPCLMPKR